MCTTMAKADYTEQCLQFQTQIEVTDIHCLLKVNSTLDSSLTIACQNVNRVSTNFVNLEGPQV